MGYNGNKKWGTIAGTGTVWGPKHKIPAQPGLIPQMSGFLTSQHLWGCTNFVDHVSDYVYVQIMRDLGLEETLLAKADWTKVLSQAGCQVNTLSCR